LVFEIEKLFCYVYLNKSDGERFGIKGLVQIARGECVLAALQVGIKLCVRYFEHVAQQPVIHLHDI
jgi:hypothetical protein